MKVYDLEHHYYNPELVEYLKVRETPPMYRDGGMLIYHKGAMLPMGAKNEILGNLCMMDIISDLGEMRLKNMDNAGVDVAVVSSGALIENLPKEEAIKYARITNNAIAEACRKYPDRFLGTICLPTTYVDEAIKELVRAVNELGLKYFHTHSNYGKETLADDKYIPLLAKCEELGVAIYIHPHNPASEYLLESGMMFSSAGFGFGVDTMKTSLNIILKGRLDQFPKLKIVLGHMGEFYPYLLERLNNRFFCVPDPDVKCKHNFTYYFQNKNIFMTTSGIEDPDVALFAIKKIGIDSIMMGSDYPYEDFKKSVDFVKELPISDEDKEKIFYKNAEKYILNR
uniref:Amidohydrolase-related domain-containing protein n=1 Tax=uncultured bacterium fosmid pJB84G2 TaxID=1478072 RepID=A0A0H3U7Z5_9BACT|nr:hypothetical protein [uncultured bacterium fosmid pJB84G2]